MNALQIMSEFDEKYGQFAKIEFPEHFWNNGFRFSEKFRSSFDFCTRLPSCLIAAVDARVEGAEAPAFDPEANRLRRLLAAEKPLTIETSPLTPPGPLFAEPRIIMPLDVAELEPERSSTIPPFEVAP